MSVERSKVDVLRQSLPTRSFWEKALPWVSAALLAAGVIVLILKLFPSTSGTQSGGKTENPQIVPKNPKTVPLEPEARRVAGKFILTAVQRKNLDQAWEISGPEIRAGVTYKQWLTGNIAVIPFLDPIKLTTLKIDYSWRNQAVVEVGLVPKAKGPVAYFYLELKRVGQGAKGAWKVWSWVPAGSAPIPINPNQ